MPKKAQIVALKAFVILAFVGLFAGRAEALPSLDEMLAEKALGKADAPVTIIEYASLGCPHCAQFHADTLPLIKKKYIDTGKVRMVFRDFPLGRPALAASMIARCSGTKRYFGMIDILFRDQPKWAAGQNVLEELTASARKGGLSSADVQACLRTEPLLIGVRELAQQGQQKHGVNATPSFVIGGETHAGSLPFSEFERLIERELK